MRFSLVIAWCIATLGSGGLRSSPATAMRLESSGGPYCGVYCVYSALNSFGILVSFEELLDPKYIGSGMGSTIAELRAAVEDFGGHSIAMQGLTAGTLRTAAHPIILHVRRPGLDLPYAHWVLFLGMDGEYARIVDPPNSVQLLSLPELLALWDGAGLIVSPEPINRAPIRGMAYVEQIVLLFLVLAVCIGWRAAFPRARWAGPAAFAATSVLAALTYHVVHDQGILTNRTAMAQVMGAHFKPTLAQVTTDEVTDMIAQSDVLFIDARYPGDYKAGHLPGAVSLPVYSGLVERRDMLAAVDSKRRVVVYCQSESCHWGDIIAGDLMFRGYKNVAVYRGGYREWRERERRKPSP